MSYFATTRAAGPAWTPGRGAFDQPGVQDHAVFMNSLADEGFVLFAGPLDGTEQDRIRALLVVSAHDEAEIRDRLALDPMDDLRTPRGDQHRAVERDRRRGATRRRGDALTKPQSRGTAGNQGFHMPRGANGAHSPCGWAKRSATRYSTAGW